MNTPKLYNGFFNNVGANPLDSLLTEVIQYILDSQSSVLSNYVNIMGSNIGCNGVNYSSSSHVSYDVLQVLVSMPQDRLPKRIKYIEISKYPNTPDANETVNKIRSMFVRAKIKTIKTKR